MAAYTFAALYLAHVLADYVLQPGWIVINKRRPIAMAIHITVVLITMVLTTFSFSAWFIALAVAHLWIDIVKTYAMREGLTAYTVDQILHVGSVVGIALLAPDIWTASPLVDVPNLPVYYMMAGGALIAARGGQYAVEMLAARHGPPSTHGVLMGWAERVALCVVLIGGWPLWVGAILAGKAVFVAATYQSRPADGRARLWLGTVISLGWGLAVAVPLALVMPMME